MGWHHYDPDRRRLILTTHVQPGARRTEITGEHGGALKIKIAAPAAEQKANAALIEFLHNLLGVAKSAVAIRHGAKSRRKVVEIAGGPDLAARLEKLSR